MGSSRSAGQQGRWTTHQARTPPRRAVFVLCSAQFEDIYGHWTVTRSPFLALGGRLLHKPFNVRYASMRVLAPQLLQATRRMSDMSTHTHTRRMQLQRAVSRQWQRQNQIKRIRQICHNNNKKP